MSDGVDSADEVRHELYEIMSRDVPFEAKATAALELGTAYLGVDTGFVSRIVPELDHYEVIVSTADQDGVIPPGLQTDLSGTYCRHTLERESPLAAHNVSESEGFDDHNPDLQCYHGTTLTVADETFGTVCFVAREARPDSFTEAETMFAELVARLLEHELEHRHQQEELTRQTSLVNLLDRVLRHNIRNDMTVVRANAKLHAEEHEECEACDTIIQKSDKLIELSETARELGKVINTTYDPRPVEFVTLLEDLVGQARTQYPNATFSLEAPGELTVGLRPSMETALWELLENAGDHAGEAPAVHIRVTADSGDVRIGISDDGPGLPAPEQDILEEGAESPLVHGSGLGLWSVYWAVATHNGALEIDATNGTSVTISIPQRASVELPDHRSRETESTAEPAIANRSQPYISRAGGRYRAIFEAIDLPLLLCDDDWCVIEVNERAGTLFGEPVEAIVGRDLESMLRGTVPDLADATEGTLPIITTDGNRSVTYHLTRNVIPGHHLIVCYE